MTTIQSKPMTVEQYTILVGVLKDWMEQHPDEVYAINTINSIKFVRTR